MSATRLAPSLPADGTTSSDQELKDVVEYEKILKLRDEIFAGTHPRLKVPPGAVRKVTPRSVQTPPLPSTAAKEVSTGLPPAQTNGISHHNANSVRANSNLSASPSVPRMPPQKLSSSELDPIFLTKSDTLKNAEFSLKRQRVERILREQYEQGQKPTVSSDGRPDFDVSEVLAKALDLVKPVTFGDANGNTTATDSFDENSLYSSRAPDSTPERAPYRPSSSPRNQQHQLVDNDDYDADRHAETVNHGSKPQYPRDGRNVANACHGDPAPKPNSRDRYPPRSRQPIQYDSPRAPDDDLDEPEYFPPEPDEPVAVNRGNLTGAPPQQKGSNGRPYRHEQRNGSPMSDVRIVRNHITSPAAPQPARVSPLAVAKAPPIPPARHQLGGHGYDSARTSPEPEPNQARKRRRGQDGSNRGRNGPNKNNKDGPTPRKKARHSNTQRTQESPEPYIKPEPVSPPPFPNGQGLAPPKVREVVDRPGPVEYHSPRELRYVSYPDGSDFDPRLRPLRDDQDLRRVASYNARQPILHQEYVEPSSPAHAAPLRSQSYTLVDRQPVAQQSRYYEDAYSRPIIRSERSPSPVPRERFADVEPDARMMAPPQRRILVDENGNKYYDTAPIPRTQQTMAPPASRPPRMESYQEPVATRKSSLRATSVFEDSQGRRYISEMPPPQPAYRRVTELADPYQGSGLVERRVYDRPEYEQRPTYRSASAQVFDYPQRQPRYIEEAVAPREEIVRMSSVRPMQSRYDDQPQMIQRVQSVRPEARAVSMFVDDHRRPREYIQAATDGPSYEYVRQPREARYIEDDDMGRVMVEAPRSGSHRY